MNKEKLIAATPELLELEAFLEKFQKEKPKPALQWHETAGCLAGTGQALPIDPAEIIKKNSKPVLQWPKPVIEKSYQEKLNELARPALRWYPSWSAFSNCLHCGDALFGLGPALCDECEEARQKEKKDSTPDFRFSEWD